MDRCQRLLGYQSQHTDFFCNCLALADKIRIDLLTCSGFLSAGYKRTKWTIVERKNVSKWVGLSKLCIRPIAYPLSVMGQYRSVYLSICLFVCLSVYLSIDLPTSLSVCPSIRYRVLIMPVNLSVCLLIYLSVYLSTHLPVPLSIYN